MSKISKEQLVTECASKALTSIIDGNLKRAISQVIEDVIAWTEDKSLIAGEVLLCEDHKTSCGCKQPVADSSLPTPAPVGNEVVSNDRTVTEGARVGAAPRSPGWSDPFAGTSWGVKK